MSKHDSRRATGGGVQTIGVVPSIPAEAFTT